MKARTCAAAALAALALAGLALTACDAGVDTAARAAVERSGKVHVPLGPMGPAEDILSAHAADIAATQSAYEAAMQAAGYGLALDEVSLTTPAEFAKAKARIAASKAAAVAHKRAALAHTDAAIARLQALAKANPDKDELALSMARELAAVRARRETHWTHAEQIIDETAAAWTTLDAARGAWTLRQDGLKFDRMRDREAYDAHAWKITAFTDRQDAIRAEQERSMQTLQSLARRYDR